MILGLGTDLVSIAGVRQRLERTPGLAERICDPSELAAGASSRDPGRAFAERFAAKEAVMKALGTGWAQGVTFADIVVCDPEMAGPGAGNPRVELRGAAGALLASQNARVLLSVSSDGGYAVALVVLVAPAESG
ncbi:MAG: holo-ACP synthase [bacterium]